MYIKKYYYFIMQAREEQAKQEQHQWLLLQQQGLVGAEGVPQPYVPPPITPKAEDDIDDDYS